MTDSPPRKRFQIHLSTAIVMMCVAGALLWANTTGDRVWRLQKIEGNRLFDTAEINISEAEFLSKQTWDKWWVYRWRQYGWPAVAATTISNYSVTQNGERINNWSHGTAWAYPAAFIDGIVALIILSTFGIIVEWLIRRRAVQKEN